jgi:hypothetical protein
MAIDLSRRIPRGGPLGFTYLALSSVNMFDAYAQLYQNRKEDNYDDMDILRTEELVFLPIEEKVPPFESPDYFDWLAGFLADKDPELCFGFRPAGRNLGKIKKSLDYIRGEVLYCFIGSAEPSYKLNYDK